MPVFRHFEEEAALVYKKTDEITPDERRRFIDQVRFPGKKTGVFKPNAFDEAVSAVVDTWVVSSSTLRTINRMRQLPTSGTGTLIPE
jgi:hypothetical protein